MEISAPDGVTVVLVHGAWADERALAARMRAKTTELKASHLSLLSMPEAVAAVILDAVAATASPG
jgi:hypothetical protein